MIIGFFLIGIGFTIEGSLPFFAAVLLNQVIWGIGSTFTSGALEAWIVDEVGEERMGPVFLRGSQAGQIGGIAGILISVALGSIALALPVVVGGLAFVGLAIFLVLIMPETGFKPTPRGERTHWQSMFEPAARWRQAGAPPPAAADLSGNCRWWAASTAKALTGSGRRICCAI